MTFDEIKNTLLTSHDEGVDSAEAYDTVLTEISSMITNLAEANRQVEDLTNRVATLTDNNLKLLDKIRYVEQEEVKEGPEPETITIDNLFEEE